MMNHIEPGAPEYQKSVTGNNFLQAEIHKDIWGTSIGNGDFWYWETSTFWPVNQMEHKTWGSETFCNYLPYYGISFDTLAATLGYLIEGI